MLKVAGNMLKIFLFIMYCLLSTAVEIAHGEVVYLGPIMLNGSWQQGALLYGQAPPGTRLEFLGQIPVVLADGRFILGLDRDAPASVELKASVQGHSWQVKHPVATRQYDVQKITGVEDKFVNPDPSLTARIEREAKMVDQARSLRNKTDAALKPFIWPAKGPISGVYGSQRVFNGVPKRPHYGLDIAGPLGAPVYAPQSGLVTLAQTDLFYTGGTVILDHGLGLTSTCMHLSRVLVEVGQQVKQGDLIGLIGKTGRVTGPHLDWRMNWHNQHIDPEPLVRGKPMPGDDQISNESGTKMRPNSKP